MMEHQEYQELLASQALDALDASQAGDLTEHLRECAECRAELAESRDAAALLAYAATPTDPGPQVRARILEEIQKHPRRLADSSSPVIPLNPPTRTIWPIVLRLAAGLAFVALLIGLVVLWRRDSAARKELVRLSNQVNRQQRELQAERSKLTRQNEALSLLNSQDTKKVHLAGTQTAQNARAVFVFDQKSGRGMLIAEGLPTAPPDKAYEVWFIPKGHSPIAGKVFTVDATGSSFVADNIPAEARESAVIAITLEPKGGSAAPTGAIYLASPAG